MDLSRAERRAEQIIRERPAYAEIIPAWLRILTLLEELRLEAEERTEGSYAAPPREGSGAAALWEELAGEGEILHSFFCSVAGEFARSLNPDAEGLARRWREDPVGLRDVALAILRGEGINEHPLGESERALMAFMVRLSARPLLRALSSRAAGDELWKGEWLKGDCPICGSSPSLSIIPGEGEPRELYCSLCDLRWRFLRLACPYCGNSDHRRLGHICVEGGDGYRIETCAECKGYIKTILSEKLGGSVIPSLEEMATLHLDVIAADSGYRTPGSLIPSAGMMGSCYPPPRGGGRF